MYIKLNLPELISYILHLPIEVIITLIVLGIFEFLPIFLGAYLLKRHVKVGKVDLPLVTLVWIVFNFILFVILMVFLPTELFMMFYALAGGFLFSFIFFFPIFNAITSEALKTYIFLIDLEKRDLEDHVCYVYNQNKKQYVIELDSDGHESIGSLLKRVFQKRWEFVCEGVTLEFTVNLIHRGIFATEFYQEKGAVIDEETGKKVDYVRRYVVKSVETHKFNEIEFLTNLASYEDMLETVRSLWQENTDYKRNTIIIARRMAQDMVQALNDAYELGLEDAWNKIKGEYPEFFTKEEEKRAETET